MFREGGPSPEEMGIKEEKPIKKGQSWIKKAAMGAALLGASFGAENAQAQRQPTSPEKQGTKVTDVEKEQSHRLLEFDELLNRTEKLTFQVEKETEEESLKQLYGRQALDFAKQMVRAKQTMQFALGQGDEYLNKNREIFEAAKLNYEFKDAVLKNQEFQEFLAGRLGGGASGKESLEPSGYLNTTITVGEKEYSVMLTYSFGRGPEGEQKDSAGYELMARKAATVYEDLMWKNMTNKPNIPRAFEGVRKGIKSGDVSFDLFTKAGNLQDGFVLVRAVGVEVKK